MIYLMGENIDLEEDMKIKVGNNKIWFVECAIKEGIRRSYARLILQRRKKQLRRIWSLGLLVVRVAFISIWHVC
jgi:hypothetical protein